ncbi:MULTISPECIES: diaminopimelate epimerase [unclassified Thiocapsa]|uniref:diaminopimelate epimerase n=1 Tax=unclassified Thiocapsa TaxID=2641286 RepID=UPI0035B45F6C
MAAQPFWRLSAHGNAFVCIDVSLTSSSVPSLQALHGTVAGLWDFAAAAARLARRVCDPCQGFGVDGLILARRMAPAAGADLAVRFLEPDGGEATLCGNGLACLAHWFLERSSVVGARVLTHCGPMLVKRAGPSCYAVTLPRPRIRADGLRLTLGDIVYPAALVEVGVPHLVVAVRNLMGVDVVHLGRELRWHAAFCAERLNVNFVEARGPGRLTQRTFEAGVERETLACGTGAAASSWVMARQLGWAALPGGADAPVRVAVAGGGELLVVPIRDRGGTLAGVCLLSQVALLGAGVVPLGWLADAWSA